MVPDSGTPARPHHIRALNEPRPITVELDHGIPTVATIDTHRFTVEHIQDTWTIEDEWWRHPISRQYFALLLGDGSVQTVFHDRVADAWYAQEY